MRVSGVDDVPDSELEMTRYDTMFLVISCCVTSEFEDLSSEILEDGGEVNYKKN